MYDKQLLYSVPTRYRTQHFFNNSNANEDIAGVRSLCGPASVVGIATAYGLGGPGIKSRWGEIFRTCPDRP